MSIYGEGIWICNDCYRLIDEHRHKPYSQVMDKVAMLEVGYHVNRKAAKIRRG
jgi:ribosomal protein L37AE/L43A